MLGIDWQLMALVMLVACGIMAALWIYLDASEHTTNGCAWAAFALTCWPVVVPLYIFLRIAVKRRRPTPRISDLTTDEMSKEEQFRRKFAGDIERAQYLAYVAKHSVGTMYEPDEAAGKYKGFPHFTDQRAEAFINQQRYAEAVDHLTEMLEVARRDHDKRAEETYYHYFSKIPEGRMHLRSWLDRQNPPAAESPTKPPARRVEREPDVPF